MHTLLSLALAAIAAQAPLDSFATLDGWALHTDGGGGLQFALDSRWATSPPSALRLTFDPAGTPGWGNLARGITLPPDARAVALRLRVVRAEPGAAVHVWLLESDGDGHLIRICPGGRELDAAERDAWLSVRLPLTNFAFQPRGDKRADLTRVNRLLLGCNFQRLEVVVDDLAIETGLPPQPVPLPRSATWAPADGPRGRVALLDEPGLARTAGGYEPAALAALLTTHGFGATRVRAGDLTDPQRLRRASFDVLLVNAPGFPLAAAKALRDWLKAGGAVLTCGGYAFDQPAVLLDDGWQPAQPAADAAARLNTRFGKPGDTMALDPLQIGLFDPTALLTRVVAAELGETRLTAALEGYAGVSMAGSNSAVFPDQHGEVEPLGRGLDRFGRSRGALGVLAQHFAGPYAGGAWGGFGVTNRWLFGLDAFGPEPLLRALDRLVGGVFVHSLRAEPVCVRAGESARLVCTLRNRGTRPATARVVLSVDGQEVGGVTQALEPGASTEVATTWQPPPGERDLHRVRADLCLGEQVVQTRETGLCVWQPALVAKGRTLTWRGNYFETAGRPLFLTGTNQTGVMWHSPREEPLTWDRDFATMADGGFTVWRVLHWSPFAARDGKTPSQNPKLLGIDPPERLVRQTDAMVQLAQKHGVVFFPCTHDWIGVALSDEDLAAQRRWNRFWASRYKDVPGLIWDIQNEPTVEWDVNNPPAHVVELYARFLTERHGELAAARAWLGLAPEARLLPKPGHGAWGDLASVAHQQFRVWLLQRWIAANAAGLREGNPRALVTVGFLQMRENADKISGVRGLDFSNTHSYDPSRAFATSLRFADRRAYGQGLTLGEFGAREFHGLRVNGGDGEAGDRDRRLFATTVGLTLGSGGAMALNWCWRGLPDVVFPWELFRSDRVPRPPLADFAALTLATRALQPVYQPPATYLLLPDEHRLGPRFRELDAALAKAVDTLVGLGLPFALLNERDLANIPREAQAILWPLPYCPADATFETVRRWVEAGGRLYLSGDVGFAPRRQYTRGARLTALGLPPGLGVDPFSARDTGQTPPIATLGRGQVTFVPWPVELRDPGRLRGLYAQFLRSAGVARWPLTPDDGEVQAGLIPCQDGSQAFVAASWGQPRDITLGGKPDLTLRVDRDHLGYAHLAEGALLGVMAQGAVSCGGPVIEATGPAMALSRDGEDLRRSRALVLVPLSAGPVTLHTRARWQAPVALVGEVRDGAWHDLDRAELRLADGKLSLTFGEEHLNTLVVIAERDEAGAVAAALAREVLAR